MICRFKNNIIPCISGVLIVNEKEIFLSPKDTLNHIVAEI
jgi:hypothetical protein